MPHTLPLPRSSVAGLSVVELGAADVALLQRFFERNPAYFLAVFGRPAQADEAHEELHEPLPEGWSFTKQCRLGWREAGGELAAMANITSDLLAPGVWHIGLFIVASARHGQGDAQALYRDVEAWAAVHGAAWLRLGVVVGNARAERFWERMGFREVRRREDVEMGARVNTLSVMMKPLGGGTVAEYLALVPRDRPGA